MDQHEEEDPFLVNEDPYVGEEANGKEILAATALYMGLILVLWYLSTLGE